MVQFTTSIHKYGAQGEKTGWTYIEIPEDLADQLNNGVRKSYRVKGWLDQHPIQGLALIPVGGGAFILPLNATIRKAIAKKEGAMLAVRLTIDKEAYQLNPKLEAALQEAALASKAFYAKPRSHQNYYSKWVDAAKMEATQDKRIGYIITSLEHGLTYAQMLAAQRADKGLLG